MFLRLYPSTKCWPVAKNLQPVMSGCLSPLTCFGVEHQNICSRPEKLLEVFVVTDFLYERRHLHCLQHRREPHLVKHMDTTITTSALCDNTNIQQQGRLSTLMNLPVPIKISPEHYMQKWAILERDTYTEASTLTTVQTRQNAVSKISLYWEWVRNSATGGDLHH